MWFFKLASLGSFVGIMAVLVSLISVYLQIGNLKKQLRLSEKNHRSLMQRGRSARVIDLLLRQTEPHLREIMSRGRLGEVSMAPAEVAVFLDVQFATFLNYEDTFLQHREGNLELSAWSTAAARLRETLSWVGHRAAWNSVRDRFDDAYASTVDKVMNEAALSQRIVEHEQWKTYVTAEKGEDRPPNVATQQ
jgi:hypothetical protein